MKEQLSVAHFAAPALSQTTVTKELRCSRALIAMWSTAVIANGPSYNVHHRKAKGYKGAGSKVRLSISVPCLSPSG